MGVVGTCVLPRCGNSPLGKLQPESSGGLTVSWDDNCSQEGVKIYLERLMRTSNGHIVSPYMCVALGKARRKGTSP